MLNSRGHVARDIGRNLNLAKSVRLWALVIAFTMIATPFFAVVGYADSQAEIWTSKDEYLPGETVLVFGKGFVPFVIVTINLTHPDFETRTYYEEPDIYGRFVMDDYTAEWVSTPDVPVTVTARQESSSGVLEATTTFKDPAAYIQGYTLRPNMRWTTGDIKGYIEGDSVPMEVALNKNLFGGVSSVNITIGVDFIDLNGPVPRYGIDYLTQYWVDPPASPFNMYPNSSMPFYVDPSQGTVSGQTRLPNIYDGGGFQVVQVWKFTLTFAPGAREAFVKFGAHLALTNLPAGYLGASYYPGSSLHVRMVALDPSADDGNRDVPIALASVLTPPKMNVEKSCDPCRVVEGDVITFTVHFNNTGQANAGCVELQDWLDDVVDLIPGSFLFWTSENPTPMAPSPGPVVTGNDWYWYLGYWRGTGSDDSLPPLEGYLQFQGVVTTNEPGCYYNRVYLNYSDDHGGVYPMEHAWCRFCIIAEPSIDIEKSGPEYAHVGDTITYTYLVTNTGDVDLVDVDIIDDVAGTVAVDQALAAGESRSYTVSYTITGSDPDPLVNEVTVTGKDDYGRTVTDDDTWEVDILHPMIEVEKSANKECAEVGEMVWYTITVSNPSSDTTLYNVLVVDTILGTIWTGTLLAGQWETEVIPYTVAADDPDPLVNIVTATGEDLLGLVVSDEARWSIDILHPMISIEKGADKECAEIGETVTYWINVSNPSHDTTMTAEIHDDLLGVHIFGIVLAPGEWYNISGLAYTVTAQDPDPLVNTAYTIALDRQEHVARASASWTVDIYHPMIDIYKWADLRCAEEGETITYWIDVSNPSPDTPMYAEVYDLMLSPLPLFAGWIAPTVTVNLGPYYYVVPEGTEWVENIAWVEAVDAQGHERRDMSSWLVEIFHPDIYIEKWADLRCAEEGETITYWIYVENPSWDATMYAVVEDLMLSPLPLFQGYLAPGGWVLLGPYPYIVPEGAEVVENTATVVAWDHQDHERRASSSWFVDILHPDVAIYKWADLECAEEGETITYYIDVWNPSYDVSMYAEVWDLMLSPLMLFQGSIAPGGTVHLGPYYYTVPEDTEWVINTAWVDAWDYQDHYRNAESTWVVEVFHPDIYIEKWADLECAEEGETITYWIYVWNPSWDATMYAVVEDLMLSSSPLFEGYLAPDDWVLLGPYPYVVPDGVEVVENTATVVAWDHQGHERRASSSWFVDVLHPGIEITKWADLTCAEEGETVTYWIDVYNPSYDVSMYAEVWDLMLSPQMLFQGSIAPGGTVHLGPYYYTVPEGVEWVINTAWVDAWDYQEHYRYAESTWVVEIFHPDICIEKWADLECAEEGETITYWIDVWNPSWDTTMTVTVWDLMLSPVPLYQGALGPGDLVPLGPYYYTVPEDTEWVINTAWVEAYDHQEHYRYAESTWVVEVFHPDIAIYKWADLECAHDGETITYWIDVYNPSWDATMYAEVWDLMLSPVPLFSGSLGPGTIVHLGPYYYTVPVGSEWVNNTAWVEAYDHQDHYRYAEANWSVEILHPDIDVTKEGPEYASAGETITYYVNVTNTGDTELFDVAVTDSLVGLITVISMMAIGEKVCLTYTYVVPSGQQLDNTVWVSGEDRQRYQVTDEDSWTVLMYSRITGYKYADLDQDGVMDESEPGLINWVIVLNGTLDDGTYDNRTRLTDSDGYYEFSLLKAGVYVVSEVMLSGWKAITATSYTVVVGSGEAFVRSFGNIPTGNISGHKWWDLDLDGVWDDDEDPIEGWTIYLEGTDRNGDPVALMTTTDVYGYYIFEELIPGVYVVREEARDGWYPTTSMTVEVDVSDLEPFEVTDIDFGNAKFGRIIGVKWLDEYMNGLWDGYEPGLPGWVIWIEGTLANGTHYGPYWTLTDANGYYVFEDLLPGVYTVWEDLLPGWVNITPSSWTITIVEGSDITCAKFGNVEYGSIDGWKFLDWDMDGLKDGDEPGIPGWAITLTGWQNDGDAPWSSAGATVVGPITIYTDANGYWAFPNLLPGVYTVTEESRVGWYHVTVPSHTAWITSGRHVYDVKFGNVPYTCIEGYKFEDVNGNGVWDEGEPGLPGWTIALEGWTNAGAYVYIEMITDETGYYATCFNVLPGEYVLYEVLEQGGWLNTTPVYYIVVIPRSMQPQTLYYEFGNFELGCIWGYKYEDMNGNGVLDEGDVPIEGWVIWLYGPMGYVDWTMTGPDGYFEFCYLRYGLYRIVEEDRVGWVHMTESFFDVLIVSGSMVELDPFLNVELSKVYGYKFEDLNSNGVWDEGEPGLPGWTLYMIWDQDDTVYTAVTGAGGYYEFTGLMPDTFYMVWEEQRAGWTATTLTWHVFGIESGSCIRVPDFGNFENVNITVFKYDDADGDGRYDSEIDTPIVGWNITVSGPGIPGGSVVLQTGAGGYASVTVTAAGTYTVEEEVRDGWCPTTPTLAYVDVMSGMVEPDLVMFGNFRCVDITIFKYEDVNSNGVYDNDDVPLEGWIFYLMREYGDPTILVTGPDGTIDVRICEAGLWYIAENMPFGWCPITPEESEYFLLVQSGVVYNLETQEEQYRFEFGNFECVWIEVFKYWDTCSNGWYDPEVGDVPLEGWWIGLYDASGALLDWGYTDEYGLVYFSICRAGTYYVVEEQREGWSPIQPLEGMYEVEVASGDGVITLWFGNYEHVDVPIFKYEDVNSNGVYDEGDRPLPNWYFELERIGGGAAYSGYTDAYGYLVLTVNRSGIYELTEEDRVGWTHVDPAGGKRLVSVTSGIEVPVQMFGNFHNVTIVVFKFDDIMADGQYEPGEGDVPIGGWTFWLWEETSPGMWQLVGSAVTNASGIALFWVTSAGSYKVVEEARDGWIWILPRTGVYYIDVHSCMGEIELWFANFKMGKIYGWKWNDLNGNGEWDEGEPGLPGWTVWFEGYLGGGGGGGYITGYTTTDASGYYEFTGLPPGYYTVWEVQQGGWTATSPPEVEVEIWGHSEVRVDFFNFQLGCIYGYKYEDMNGNGVYDEGDVPLPGWTIYLSITTGIIETEEGPISAIALIAWTTTDQNGFYSFCGLGPGIYIVDEEGRTGWVHTTPPSETVVMTSGAMIRIHDFLNFELGKICGYKFEDLNSNGVWDEGEPGIANWPIYMVKDDEDGVYVAYTDEKGRFCFSGLYADWYLIWEADREGWTHTNQTWAIVTITSGACIELDPFGNFENVTIPIFKYEDVNGNGVYDNGDEPIEGWMFTVTGPCFAVPLVVYTGADGWAYVYVTAAGEYVVTEEDRPGWMHTVPESGTCSVTVSSGVLLRPLKFGNFELGQITGLKFYDWNMNGIQDEGEPGLANWVVWINGTLVSGGWLNFTRITDSNGYFSVSGLPAGTYVVSERLEYAPPGWWPTTSPTATIVVSSGTIASVSFGNSVTGVIKGYKFYDKDLDGLWDDGEPGLAGWTVVLEGYTDQGVYVYRTVTTDSNGLFVFDLVQPGSYTVTEVLWAGWTNTTTLPVVIDVSGTMVYFEIWVNIGNVRYALIYGYKFLDTYEESYPFWPNGVFDEDEYGLGNWKITLEGWTDTGERVERVTYTDNMEDIGYYEFTDVLPGTYWVNETLLMGYYATTPISNQIMVYPFPHGMVCIRIDFGNLIPNVDPEVNFVLQRGWNLWSAPIEVDGLMASGLLEAIGPAGLLVTQLNKSSGQYESYVVKDDPEDDFPIVHGQGYFIWVSGLVSFSLMGDLVPGSESELGKGWNIVGYSSMRPTTASQLVGMVEGANAWVVTYLDAETGRYYSYVAGDGPEEDFTITPGRAYFVWVDGPGTLVFPEL